MRGYLAAAALGLILGLIAGNRATAQGDFPGCPASPAPSVSVTPTPSPAPSITPRRTP